MDSSILSDESRGESFTNPSFKIFDREINYFYRKVVIGNFAWFPNGEQTVSYNSAIYRMDVAGESHVWVVNVDGTELRPNKINIEKHRRIARCSTLVLFLPWFGLSKIKQI